MTSMASAETTSAEAFETQTAALLAQLSHLMEEKLRLEKHEIPALELMYMKALGEAELKRHHAQMCVKRAERRRVLLQLRVNRGLSLDTSATDGIERQLEREYQQWAQELHDEAQKVTNAMDKSVHVIPEEQYRQIKTLYRKLARALHPDLSSLRGADVADWWVQTQVAYERCDWSALAALWACVEPLHHPIVSQEISATEQATRLTELQRIIDEKERAIEALRQSVPLCYARQIMDDQWIQRRQHTVEAEIETLMQRLAVLDAENERLMLQMQSATYLH